MADESKEKYRVDYLFNISIPKDNLNLQFTGENCNINPLIHDKEHGSTSTSY